MYIPDCSAALMAVLSMTVKALEGDLFEDEARTKSYKTKCRGNPTGTAIST